MLREFVEALQAGGAAAPSPALTEFATRASRLGPRSLVSEAEALAKTEDPVQVAGVVAQTLRGLVGDLEEHGAHSEFADEAAFIRKAAKAWAKQAGPIATSDVLMKDDVENSLVAEVEYLDLPRAQKAAWATLRKSNRLPAALKKIVKKTQAPWFAELIAAYISRELLSISKSSRAESWQSKLSDVPALLDALVAVGRPPIFGTRALRSANRIVLRHEDAATRKSLEKLGALRATASDRNEAKRAKRLSAARRVR